MRMELIFGKAKDDDKNLRDMFAWLACRLSKIGGGVASVTLVMSTMLILAEVVGRKLFGWSTYIELEGSCYLMVAAVFIGAAYTLKTDGHISVTIVSGRLPQRIRGYLELFTSFVSLFLLIFLSWYFWKMVIRDYQLMATDLSVWSIPMWMPKSLMAGGTCLLALQFVVNIIESWGRISRPMAPDGGDSAHIKETLER